MKKIVLIMLGIACMVTSLVSCKKDDGQLVPTPFIGTFNAVNADPYSGNSTAGGLVYIVVKQKWETGLKINYYSIYPNHATGKPQSDSGEVYYNPTLLSEDIQFGSNINANLIDFQNSVNAAISKNGYVVIAASYDGGPSNNNFTIYDMGTVREYTF